MQALAAASRSAAPLFSDAFPGGEDPLLGYMRQLGQQQHVGSLLQWEPAAQPLTHQARLLHAAHACCRPIACYGRHATALLCLWHRMHNQTCRGLLPIFPNSVSLASGPMCLDHQL